MDAVLFNVISGVMPLTPAGAVPVIWRWLEEAERVGLPFTLETHRDGMSSWRARSPADATLVFLCELGPPPYAITDAQGLELSDRWQEALTLKRWAEEIWSGL